MLDHEEASGWELEYTLEEGLGRVVGVSECEEIGHARVIRSARHSLVTNSALISDANRNRPSTTV